MKEKMLLEYLKDTNNNRYDESEIEEIHDCGGTIICVEKLSGGDFSETHTITSFELLQWVYSKLRA